MEQDFYKARLVQKDIEVLIPDADSIDFINSSIFNELCLGIYSETSKDEYLNIIKDLSDKGAEGIILGCTEIGLLIRRKIRIFPCMILLLYMPVKLPCIHWKTNTEI